MSILVDADVFKMTLFGFLLCVTLNNEGVINVNGIGFGFMVLF